MKETKQTWEQANSGDWASLEEDEQGRLKQNDGELYGSSAKRARREEGDDDDRGCSVARGLIRYLVVVIDASRSSGEKDYRPSRLGAVKQLVGEFVTDFLATNALSSLGVVATSEARADVVSGLSSSQRGTLEALEKSKHVEKSKGDASLSNALGVALDLLAATPDYGHREILVLSSALATRDAKNIDATIEELVQRRVAVSVLSLAAETHVAKHIAGQTGGIFGVAMDRTHLTNLLNAHIEPPKLKKNDPRLRRPKPQLIEMGFPRLKTDPKLSLAFDESSTPTWHHTVYICPRCNARCTSLPFDCAVCHLALVSSAHLAQSYHHLFPPPRYTLRSPVAPKEELDLKPTPVQQEAPASLPVVEEPASSQVQVRCQGCNDRLPVASSRYVCVRCSSSFCESCDEFVHVSLHNCPGCCCG